MSLVTYEDARPWVRSMIRTRVAAREMPPWFADPRFGRPFVGDPRLTDAEIRTIVAWVDGGAPRGDGDAPTPPSFVEGWRTFKNRRLTPSSTCRQRSRFRRRRTACLHDLVGESVQGGQVHRGRRTAARRRQRGASLGRHRAHLTAGTVLGKGAAWKGGRCRVRADLSGRNVIQRVDRRPRSERTRALRAEAFRTTDDYRLLFYVPGGGFQQFPPGAVKRISAGNALAWNVHYTPTGKPEVDRHRLGLWFAVAPPSHEVITKRIGEAHIIEGREFVADAEGAEFPTIPPQADDWRITAITPIQDDVTLYAVAACTFAART
jgi:hypothetical protein